MNRKPFVIIFFNLKDVISFCANLIAFSNLGVLLDILMCFFSVGQIYERRLVEKFIEENGIDPISKVKLLDIGIKRKLNFKMHRRVSQKRYIS